MAPPERPRRAPRPTGGRPSGPRPGPQRGPAPEGARGPYKRREDDDETRPRPRRSEGGERTPYARRDDRGQAGKPAPRREGRSDERKPYQRRDDGPKKPYARRDEGPKRPYQRRDDGPNKPYARRDDGPKRPYQRREDSPKKPYARRDEGPKRPYQRRDDGPSKPYARRGDDDRRPVRRDDRSRREAPPAAVERPQPKGWGGVTRRGARQVTNPTPASDEAKAYERREGTRAARPTVDRWEREPTPVAAPRPKKSGAAARPIRAKSLPADVVAEVASAAGSSRRAPMLQKRLGEAARHMQHGRDRDAANLLRSLSQEVPEAASVRELYGQVLYSLGRYRQAAAELEAFVELTASTDQHPMLADSYRALGRHKKVAELWAELRETSPAPDIVAEGRIVAAGSLADQGKLHEAIRMLETAPPVRGRVQERHLRTWFALADLYERSGELAKARAAFQRVRKEDPDFVDVEDRLRALG